MADVKHKFCDEERINAGLAAARERGATLGRPRTLDRHVNAVAKLSRKGSSGRQIAAALEIPVGSVFAVLKREKQQLEVMKRIDSRAPKHV